MTNNLLNALCGLMLCSAMPGRAETPVREAADSVPQRHAACCGRDTVVSRPTRCCAPTRQEAQPTHRLQVGGYGEAVYSRNFYSDNIYRYQNPAKYRNDPSHGRMDLPHVTLSLDYDFGRRWKFYTEIEFEHGGTGGSYEQEYEEGGDWEQELERGGEVALEQFWLEREFCPEFHLRAGHITVPVGLTNAHHEPLNFFTVDRPEGESRVLPCTWHSTGISLWGRAGAWRYEVQAVAGLNALNFTRDTWIQSGSYSPFEFSVANRLGFAARADWYAAPGLRLGVSGYVGNSMHNSYPNDLSGEDENGNRKKYADVKGRVLVGCFDFSYTGHNWRIHGSADYGHLDDAAQISQIKKNLTSNNAPTDKSFVGEQAYAVGLEAGYDIFSQIAPLKRREQQLYVFGRYDQSDTYIPASGMQDYRQTLRRTLTVGLNYFPIKQIAVKAQFAQTFLHKELNDEPSVSLGIVYQGFFVK